VPGPAAAAAKLPVVLCWHMHQPLYRDLLTGEYALPWVYLHAIKDYVDMAAHLESVPKARAVVNFSPVLIEQIQDYSRSLDAHLARGVPLPDPVLASLTPAALSLEGPALRALIAACLKAHAVHLIARYPAYQALAAEAGAVLEGQAARPGLLADLSTWYHLAWLGETVRRGDQRIAALISQARGFSTADRRLLLEVIAELLRGLLPRYRQLQDTGQVELAVSPWGHPILPLLLKFGVARERMPGAVLPRDVDYPGGEERARWHLARALQVYLDAFGTRPRGCWPSEGAVSEATVALLEDFGFKWLASGEGVLRASLDAPLAEDGADRGRLHRPWRLPGRRPACFFRHDALSDLVGFTYSHWHGDDAAANFVQHLEQLANQYESEPGHVVAVVLDGENAWEHYPYNGYFFLRAIYEQLAEHPRLELSAFEDALGAGAEPRELPRLSAGSWVHADLGTWIGAPDKNRCWELLCDARRAVDAAGPLAREAVVLDQLGACEGSDWAWWFAAHNPAPAVASFDGLYRRHLANLYRVLAREPPDALAATISAGSGSPEIGGTMQRAERG
jgi:alpha-amylase/alpha-mannosidase (GH57 family)